MSNLDTCPTSTASHLCPDCTADRAERAAEDEMYRAADRAHTASADVDLCPGCHAPTHASESDDEGRCATCAAAAGEPHPIVDAEYEPGVAGRACTACNSGWPASEPDGEPWHHAVGCPLG